MPDASIEGQHADTARFTHHAVHRVSIATDVSIETPCGLRERLEIWRDPGADVTCLHCLRYSLRETPDRLDGREHT
jgi:hypothetical protein